MRTRIRVFNLVDRTLNNAAFQKVSQQLIRAIICLGAALGLTRHGAPSHSTHGVPVCPYRIRPLRPNVFAHDPVSQCDGSWIRVAGCERRLQSLLKVNRRTRCSLRINSPRRLIAYKRMQVCVATGESDRILAYEPMETR